MTSLPAVLGGAEFAPAVLRAAVLDGELYPVGDAFRPVDLPLDAIARAVSLARVATPGRVLAARTAAWVWDAAPSPGRPCRVLVAPRPGSPDVVMLGGVAVTTPMRTAVDLLCEADEDGDAAVARLLERFAIDPVDLGVELRTRWRLPARSEAIQRLQVLVTRYTS